ncbi:signal recognition particle protein component [Gammaproteobacteria bacterium]
MFENLTQRLERTLRNLRGQGRITENNIKDTLREVRMALLEADVALPVVRDFLEQIKIRAVGQEVMTSLTPGQALIKVVHEELVALMGEANQDLNLSVRPPAVILMAGLQGSGKTTTVAKLARFLKERKKKSTLVASCDIYRPAAIDQLRTLAAEVGCEFFPSTTRDNPVDIARNALDQARKRYVDVLIIDTAGRLHIDAEMMDEIKRIHAALDPVETLFVVDSMTGQDAANSARAFHGALPLTGVVLTKTDGDARGGAALSIRQITGKPIKFLGVGEKLNALEPFHPDRIASRILGMGDVLTLIEEASRNFDQEKALQMVEKLKKGKDFDLDDLRDQMRQMKQLGGMAGIMEKIPGMSSISPQIKGQLDDREFVRMEAIINSMTPQERRSPDIIKNSRKRRIAAGSGTQVQEINRLLKQFLQAQKMMKQLNRKGGIMGILRSIGATTRS